MNKFHIKSSKLVALLLIFGHLLPFFSFSPLFSLRLLIKAFTLKRACIHLCDYSQTLSYINVNEYSRIDQACSQGRKLNFGKREIHNMLFVFFPFYIAISLIPAFYRSIKNFNDTDIFVTTSPRPLI